VGGEGGGGGGGGGGGDMLGEGTDFLCSDINASKLCAG